ncbi:MAG: MbcA/ParS/Xre antitoxin family protein [Sphingorhabdus sp.]
MLLREMPASSRGFVPLPPVTDNDAVSASNVEIQAMQRAMIRLFENWNITDAEASVLLGDLSPRTFQRWKAGHLGRAGVDLVARMSNLLGIHKALRLLFEDPDRGYRWIHMPNAAFEGRSALAVMLNGQITDLMRVRRYLDAQRGQW